nr:acetamidase [Quercus suber]
MTMVSSTNFGLQLIILTFGATAYQQPIDLPTVGNTIILYFPNICPARQMATNMPTASLQDWTDIAAKAQTKTINSIPRDWRIPSSRLPSDDQLDVTALPAQSGLLSSEELAITGSYATDIVGKLAAGEWTAVEVTTAFCKRAAIAHQVVSFCDRGRRVQSGDSEKPRMPVVLLDSQAMIVLIPAFRLDA